MYRILIVEDNEDMSFGLSANFAHEGWTPVIAATGKSALDHIRSEAADIVVLDLMLPDMSGFEVLRAIRSDRCNVPVLVLSARADEIDRVTGLRLGADDYVTKPFSLLELIERVRAVGRRKLPVSPDINCTEAGSPTGLCVSVARREVTYCGVAIHLKPKEFDLLVCLIRAGGSLVSKQKLLEDVWHMRQKLKTRTVDNTYYGLKNALERAGVPAGAIRSANRQGLAWTLSVSLD